jgi:hypothetical protein
VLDKLRFTRDAGATRSVVEAGDGGIGGLVDLETLRFDNSWWDAVHVHHDRNDGLAPENSRGQVRI